jgi:hypothetical protein
VGRLAKLGVQTTNRTLSNLEHGAGLDVARLPELAAALECTVSYLIGLTRSPHRWSPDPVNDPTAPVKGRPPNESMSADHGQADPSPPEAAPQAKRPAVSSTGPEHPSGPDQEAQPERGCWILGIDVPDRHVAAGGPNLSNA